MGLLYNIYWNQGTGGPVNYAAPIATTANLSFVPASLATPSDNTFAVRCFDPSVNLEEANTDAVVRVILDANGNNVTGRPNPPRALVVRATAGGGCQIKWAYIASGQGGAPVGFSVFLTAGTVANYTTPATTVPYISGQSGYTCNLTGLSDRATYTVAVRAYNAVATEPNTTVVASVVGDVTPPVAVDGLTSILA